MWAFVIGAGAAGLLAGTAVRVLADGFTAERTVETPRYDQTLDVPQPEPASGDPRSERSARWAETDPRAERRARWAEACAVLKEASRRWPVWSWPPWVEVGTGVVCAVVAWRLAGTALLWAWGYAAVVGVLLSVVDWRTRRLPDVITLPSYLVLAALLFPSGRLGAASVGGLALGGAYAVMWFVRPDALGFGDVKLAGLAGMLAGPLGMDRWLTAAMGGLVLGALFAVMLLVTRRATMKTQFPLGPFIAAGVLVALW